MNMNMLEIFVVSFPLRVLGNWLTATKPVIDHKYQDIKWTESLLM